MGANAILLHRRKPKQISHTVTYQFNAKSTWEIIILTLMILSVELGLRNVDYFLLFRCLIQ